MHKRLFSFFSFAVTIVILAVALMVMNWLPSVIQQGTMRKYSSIEELKSKLNIRDIYVPSYFPQSFQWPPSRILAQAKPFAAIVMEFRHMGTGDSALIISQAASPRFVPDKKIKIVQIKERVAYSLKGREALLEVGACKNDEPCSQISWNEGKYRIMVIIKSTPFDLIKIADSMLR
ncbi:MAG: hypothetical protein M1508_02950 [Nitrospirae bacterium]|nr:hypothetical protein [Nitrospirota bacterium]